MKRLLRMITIITFIFMTTNVFAATCSLSANKTNAYVGDNVTVTVSIFAGTWNVKVNGVTNPESIVGFDMDKNASTTKTYTVDTSSVGTKTIKVTGDITDYDTEATTYPNKTITINVTARPAEPVKPVEPTTKVVTTTKQRTTKATVQNAGTIVVPVQEETPTTTVPFEEDKKEEVLGSEENNDIDITTFKIVGYNLDFDKYNLDYTIDVYKDVSELYIIVEGDEITADNIGVVDIKDKDLIKVTVKKNNNELTYTININRIYPSSNRG
ncbi:MAG: hypothetical protein K6C11_00835, partial [Bacilli bacterium]|nr:hypothetical protein [Bacilli bacterium]